MLKFAQMSSKEEKEQLKEDKKIYLASNNFDKPSISKLKTKRTKK